MEQEQQKGVCGSGEKIEAEYQEGRARGEFQGKMDKELEGQAWIKERRDRSPLKEFEKACKFYQTKESVLNSRDKEE